MKKGLMDITSLSLFKSAFKKVMALLVTGANLAKISSFADVAAMNSPADVAISGNVAYVITSVSDAIVSIDISDPANMTMLQSFSSAEMASLRNLTISGDVAYLTDYSYGIIAIDISDPSNMSQLSVLSDVAEPALSGSMDVTVSDDGNTLFVSAFDVDTISAVNISNPASMSIISSYAIAYFDGAIGMKTVGDVLYVIGNARNAITSVDISNLNAMVFIQSKSIFAESLAPYDLVIKDGVAFITSVNDDSVASYNISNPADMVLMDVLTDVTYLDSVQELALIDNVLCVISYNDNALTTIDVSDPSNLVIIDSITGILLNSPTGLAISGTTAYVTASSYDSLTSIDLI